MSKPSKVASKALRLEQLVHANAFGDWSDRVRIARRCAALRAETGILEMASAIIGCTPHFLDSRNDAQTLDRLLAAKIALITARKILQASPGLPAPAHALTSESTCTGTAQSPAEAPNEPPAKTDPVTADLWWLSWEQSVVSHRPYRPVAWPPPMEVLAFWQRGISEEDSTVIALVRAQSEDAAMAIIRSAWEPGIGEWRFINPYNLATAPEGFHPPPWSIEMGRWPWKTKDVP